MFYKKAFAIFCILLLITILAACGGGVGTSPISSSNGSGSGGTGGSGGGAVGAVTLTWDAPTTRTDNSLLNPATDLQIYKLYYGTASGTYTQVVNVPNPATTSISYTLNLSSGTYYFAVTAVDTFGDESGYSTEVMKTI